MYAPKTDTKKLMTGIYDDMEKKKQQEAFRRALAFGLSIPITIGISKLLDEYFPQKSKSKRARRRRGSRSRTKRKRR